MLSISWANVSSCILPQKIVASLFSSPALNIGTLTETLIGIERHGYVLPSSEILQSQFTNGCVFRGYQTQT